MIADRPFIPLAPVMSRLSFAPLSLLPACLLRGSLPGPLLLCLFHQTRAYATPSKTPQKKLPGTKKQRAARNVFITHNLRDADQFTLVDAIRYIRAFEVGQDPVKVKYELAIKLRTNKSGPTIKSRIGLPRPVRTDMRICVIAEGKQAEVAREMGAVLVGIEDVFEKVRKSRSTIMLLDG